MQSNLNDIDDLFRSKEAEAEADLSQQNDHWRKMRSALPASKSNRDLAKYLIPVAAAALIVATVMVVNRLYGDHAETNLTSAASSTLADTSKVRNLGGTVAEKKSIADQDISPAPNQRNTEVGRSIANIGNPPPVGNTISETFPDRRENSNPVLSVAEKVYNNAKVFEEFFMALQPDIQAFQIDNKRDTTIECKEGTKLFIPAGVFESLTGAAVSQVKLEVTEHYKYSDIIGNKLTTTSNGARLGTGGMIHLKASSEQKDIRIKNGKALRLKMPGKVNPQMQLFKGKTVSDTQPPEEGEVSDEPTGNNFTRPAVDWVAAGQQQVYYDPERKKVLVFNLGNYPQLRYKEKRRFFSNEVVSSTSIATFTMPHDSRYTKSQIQQMLEEKYSRYYDKIKVRQERKPLSKRKQQLESSHLSDWSTKYIGDSVWMPIKWATSMKFITREDSIKWEEKWKKELADLLKKQQEAEQYLDATAEYNFSITNMGWINCDRFLNYPSSRLTEFVVFTDMESDFQTSSAILVFKDDRNIMNVPIHNGRISVGRVPLGDKATLVAIVVREGKVYCCVQDLVISKEPARDIHFKESTPEEFKQQLRRLGTVVAN